MLVWSRSRRHRRYFGRILGATAAAPTTRQLALAPEDGDATPGGASAASDDAEAPPCVDEDSDTDDGETSPPRPVSRTTWGVGARDAAPDAAARTLEFADLEVTMAQHARLWTKTGRPAARPTARLLEPEWSRRCRLKLAPSARGALPSPKVLALTELRLHNFKTKGDYAPTFKIACADFEYTLGRAEICSREYPLSAVAADDPRRGRGAAAARLQRKTSTRKEHAGTRPRTSYGARRSRARPRFRYRSRPRS